MYHTRTIHMYVHVCARECACKCVYMHMLCVHMHLYKSIHTDIPTAAPPILLWNSRQGVSFLINSLARALARSLSLSNCFLIIIIMRTSVFIRAHMYMHADIQLSPKSLQHVIIPPPQHCLCLPSVPAPGACGVMMRQLPDQMPISADPAVSCHQRPKCHCQNCRCSRSLRSC